MEKKKDAWRISADILRVRMPKLTRPLSDEEWKTVPSPSHAEAAHRLRLLARSYEHDLERLKLRKQLWKIAECIEHGGWRKGNDEVPEERERLDIYAEQVETARRLGAPVKDALHDAVMRYAKDRAWTHPDALERAHELIAEARKRLRRRIAKSGK